VAGWLHMPFWRCTLYMLIGKFLRYIVLTAAFFEGVQRLS
jgi:membrane protein YqaA with SNARE-associated domain